MDVSLCVPGVMQQENANSKAIPSSPKLKHSGYESIMVYAKHRHSNRQSTWESMGPYNRIPLTGRPSNKCVVNVIKGEQGQTELWVVESE